MANPSKAKGDRAELEAVEYLCSMVPHLVVTKPQRMLGAGRMDDVGDLRVFPDVAIQVRNYKLSQIGQALRSAAVDATQQAENGDLPFSFGLVPYPRARKDTVRWLASWIHHPGTPHAGVEPLEFKTVSKATEWVRDDQGPYGYMVHPREQRIAHLTGSGTPVYVAPAEAWLAMYEPSQGLESLAA